MLKLTGLLFACAGYLVLHSVQKQYLIGECQIPHAPIVQMRFVYLPAEADNIAHGASSDLFLCVMVAEYLLHMYQVTSHGSICDDLFELGVTMKLSQKSDMISVDFFPLSEAGGDLSFAPTTSFVSKESSQEQAQGPSSMDMLKKFYAQDSETSTEQAGEGIQETEQAGGSEPTIQFST